MPRGRLVGGVSAAAVKNYIFLQFFIDKPWFLEIYLTFAAC
jgi:hypothetical protein